MSECLKEELDFFSFMTRANETVVLSREGLERCVGAIAARSPNMYATDGFYRCHESARGYSMITGRKGYDSKQVRAESPLLEPTDYDSAFVHSSVRVDLEGEILIVDGTYRQFFHGGKGDAEKDLRREALPKYFCGTIVELYDLFRENVDLLNGEVIRRLKINGKIEGDVEDHHIAKLVGELYKVQIKDICSEAAERWHQEQLTRIQKELDAAGYREGEQNHFDWSALYPT